MNPPSEHRHRRFTVGDKVKVIKRANADRIVMRMVGRVGQITEIHGLFHRVDFDKPVEGQPDSFPLNRHEICHV